MGQKYSIVGGAYSLFTRIVLLDWMPRELVAVLLLFLLLHVIRLRLVSMNTGLLLLINSKRIECAGKST